jgi:tripartite motif-containing protein 71
MSEVRQSQTSVFARRLTIGPADQDSDDVISTLSMGDWSGGGQIEEMTGADQTRYWWGVFDGRSPRQASLPPLVENPDSGKPSGATGTSYPLGVVNDTAYFAFGTDIAGFNETTDVWYTRETMTNAPVGKCIEFKGSLYVPTGTNGYSVITESATGNPVVTTVTGAADPTAAPATPTTVGPNPRVVHFCIAEGEKLFALTSTGGIAYSFTGAASSWYWDYNDALARYPKVQSGASPRRLIPFFNRQGNPAVFVTTSRGALIYDRSNVQLNETPIQYPEHPDVGVAATVWRPGEDLWIGTGLDTVRYTSSNVAIPLSGVSRDAGVPSNYRGAIKDLEPELSTLFALVGGVSDTYEALSYAAKLSAAGSGNGQWDGVRGLSPDSTGALFVADTNNERVQELTTTPSYTGQFGSSGTGNGQFAANNGAYDTSCDASDNVWVVDRGNARVQKFNNAGAYQSQFGSFDDGTPEVIGSNAWVLQDTYGPSFNSLDLTTPGQVAIDSTGRVLIADTGNNRLVILTSAGAYSTGITGLTGITGVCVDGSDNIFVAYDSGVAKYTSALSLTFLQTSVTDGKHVTSDGGTGVTNYIYVTRENDTIAKINNGTMAVAATLGSSGTGNGQLSVPQGIDYSSVDSHLYVGDLGNNRVQKLTTAGVYVAQWEAGGRAIAIDATGNVLCPDQIVGIERYTSAGSLIDTIAHFPTYGFDVATGDIVWATDRTTGEVMTWDEETVTPAAAIPPANGAFSAPESLDIKTSSGRIYVADTGNHRVQYFTSAGAYEGKFGNTAYSSSTGAITAGSGDGEFATPVSIAVNQSTGNVYVVDQSNDRVQYFSATGTFLGKWGVTGTGDGQFTTPTCIAVHPDTGNVIVGDSGRDDFQEFSSAGAFIRKYGSTGTGDGQFTGISGITYSADGDAIYVSDEANDRVTRINASVVTDTINALPHLQGYTGVGWHGLWQGSSNAYIPTWMEVMSVTGGYRLWWGSTDGLMYSMKLRRTLHNPREGYIAGVDRFAASGYVETANADMGMLGFTKIASHVIVFMREATTTEKVTVEYAIDDGGWTTLGEVTEAGRTVLPFNESLITSTETVSRGLSFNWIRFKLTFARGSDDTKTPVIRAFNLHFLKVPQNSSSFQFTVPLPKRKWRDRGPAEMSDALVELLESHEMVFLRHQDRLYRGRLAQVTGVDATGRDFSGIRNVNFIEIQEDGGS